MEQLPSDEQKETCSGIDNENWSKCENIEPDTAALESVNSASVKEENISYDLKIQNTTDFSIKKSLNEVKEENYATESNGEYIEPNVLSFELHEGVKEESVSEVKMSEAEVNDLINDLELVRKELSAEQTYKAKQPDGNEKHPPPAEEIPVENNKQNMVHASKQYICKNCQKAFSRKSNLARHETTHTEIEKYSDMYGKESYSNNQSLKHGLKKQNSYAKQSYDCKKCDKQFSHVKSLNAHMRNHQDGKKYGCNKCTKVFKYKSSLVSHSVIHAAELGIGTEIQNMETKTSYKMATKTSCKMETKPNKKQIFETDSEDDPEIGSKNQSNNQHTLLDKVHQILRNPKHIVHKRKI